MDVSGCMWCVHEWMYMTVYGVCESVYMCGCVWIYMGVWVRVDMCMWSVVMYMCKWWMCTCVDVYMCGCGCVSVWMCKCVDV